MLPYSEVIESYIARCKSVGIVCALPEINDRRTLEAMTILVHSGAVSKILVPANPAKFAEIVSEFGIQGDQAKELISISEDFEIADVSLAENLTTHLKESAQKKNKNLPSVKLRIMAENPLIRAAFLVRSGIAHCSVAGAVSTTADVIRAGLAGMGTSPGLKTVSGSFLLCKGKDIKLYADSGVVIDPTVDQLVDIAVSSVDTFQKLVPNEKPKVAFLSFATGESADHPAVDKVQSVYKQFKSKFPKIAADGPIQFDAAILPSVANRKIPNSECQGQSNIFIFPDLNAGNIAYKITQRLGEYEAYGPILQGLAGPFSDLSRGASAQDIAGSVFLNAVRGNLA